MTPDITALQVKPRELVAPSDERFDHPIIAQDWTTGKTTGSGIDRIWEDVHRVKEDTTMPKPIDVTKEQFLAAVKQYRSDKTIAQALKIGQSSVYKYRHLYTDDIWQMFLADKDAKIDIKSVYEVPAEELTTFEIIPSPEMLAVITEAAQSEPEIVPQPAAEEPDTECPVEGKEISVQVAIEWRNELDEEIEHVNRLPCPSGPASEIMTYRIEMGLKEIRAEFEAQVARINAVLGETRVRI